MNDRDARLIAWHKAAARFTRRDFQWTPLKVLRRIRDLQLNPNGAA